MFGGHSNGQTANVVGPETADRIYFVSSYSCTAIFHADAPHRASRIGAIESLPVAALLELLVLNDLNPVAIGILVIVSAIVDNGIYALKSLTTYQE